MKNAIKEDFQLRKLFILTVKNIIHTVFNIIRMKSKIQRKIKFKLFVMHAIIIMILKKWFLFIKVKY